MVPLKGMYQIVVSAYPEDGFVLGIGHHKAALGALPANALKTLRVDGMEPSDAGIADGKYPLFFRYYAVYLKGNEVSQKVTQWLLSEEGQKVVEKSLLVPVGPYCIHDNSCCFLP